MRLLICATCGVQQPEPDDPAMPCPICTDERQFIPAGGQVWTNGDELSRGHTVEMQQKAENLWSLRIKPAFAISQRAFLIRTPAGNVLWDCISLLDDATKSAIDQLGGISAIAISHPHYYSAMADWGRTFDVPVHVHEADADWVLQKDSCIDLWLGETLSLDGGATIIRCGGHFDGASVLHAGDLLGGRGALFSGDTIQVLPDRKHVSFMRSYPNYIPLNAAQVERICAAVEPYSFDTIHGAFDGRTIETGAKEAITRSAQRYLSAIMPATAIGEA